MPRVVAICSAASGRGERKSKAWIWATVRLIPQRVPISPQWRMNFCATGESFFIYILSYLSKKKLVKMRREVKENVAPRTTEFPERLKATAIAGGTGKAILVIETDPVTNPGQMQYRPTIPFFLMACLFKFEYSR